MARLIVFAISVVALLALALATLALAVALVGGYNFDAPPNLALAIAAAVALLIAPGLGTVVNRAIPVVAIAVLAAAAMSLSVYYEVWVAVCPECSAVDLDRAQAYGHASIFFAIVGLAAIAITGTATLIGSAFRMALLNR
jgi:hypothetical protein